jgi:hypothetical protein
MIFLECQLQFTLDKNNDFVFFLLILPDAFIS